MRKLALATIALLTLIAADKKKYEKPGDMKVDLAKTYIATVETNKGKMTFELFPKEAPKTVNSFIFLAKEGFYDGLNFHRVVPDFVIQGGDPAGDGTGGPGYSVPLEAGNNTHTHVKGALAMARAQDPDSAGSQFYITLADVHFLDKQYTVFGQIKSGEEVPAKIEKGDTITSIKVEEK